MTRGRLREAPRGNVCILHSPSRTLGRVYVLHGVSRVGFASLTKLWKLRLSWSNVLKHLKGKFESSKNNRKQYFVFNVKWSYVLVLISTQAITEGLNVCRKLGQPGRVLPRCEFPTRHQGAVWRTLRRFPPQTHSFNKVLEPWNLLCGGASISFFFFFQSVKWKVESTVMSLPPWRWLSTKENTL